jgi:aldose sugar dehydrogenase
VGQAHALPEIWSYGHRNPQGLDIDMETGDVWSTEHGPQGGDELNLILPGRNYGWPVIGYGVQYGGTTIHEARERDGMEQPLQFWTPSIATSGLLLYTEEQFPEWQGHLLVGGLGSSPWGGCGRATRPIRQHGGGAPQKLGAPVKNLPSPEIRTPRARTA